MLAQTGRLAAARCGLRLILALVCLASIAACGPRRAEPPTTAAVAVETAAPTVPPGVTVYLIDPDRSVVTLRVHRAGRLAKLGHNHVITSANESGRAWTNGTPAASGFEVRLAVADLVVDDPAARAAAGQNFPGELPQAARDGTRTNMLRPEVLDAGRYPEIVVRASSLDGDWDRPGVTAMVTLKGQTRTIQLPLALDRTDDAIVARGAFSVLQSDFGITPFSVGGGAIAVADEVEIAFEIRAVRP